jgi:PAS domain S-box-containing protein
MSGPERGNVLVDRALVADALDALDDVFYVFTPTGDLRYWNDAVPEATGYDGDELAGMVPSAFFEGEDRERVEAAIATVAENGTRTTVEADLVTKSGERVPYEFSGVPLGEREEEQLIAGIGRDRSLRRSYEERLRHQRDRLSVVLENVPVVVFALDADGVFTCSQGLGLVELGLREDEVVGESIFDVYADTPRILDNVERALDGAEVRDEVTVGDATFDTLYQPVRGADGDVERVVGVAVDVTERKARERELKRYETFIENSRDVVTLVDTDGTVLYESPAVERVLGYAPAELVGEPIFEYLHPEDRPRAVEQFGHDADDPGPTDSIEARFRHADGSWRWLESVGTNLLDDPAVGGVLVTSRDVTTRKEYEAEIEKRNEQLLVLNRIVRHDIRNDMAVALGWSEQLADHVDEEGAAIVDRIRQHDRHVVDLTKTVRDVIQTLEDDDEPALEPVDLGAVLEQVLETRTTAFAAAEFDVRTVPHVEVRANELLSSVFRNLLNNAVQHNPAGTPRVTVDADVGPETVRVRIADDGPGIPDDRKDAVFGRSDRGLDHPAAGVGLYLVDTLVDQYRGSVRVEDNDPEGTVVVVELPRATVADGD